MIKNWIHDLTNLARLTIIKDLRFYFLLLKCDEHWYLLKSFISINKLLSFFSSCGQHLFQIYSSVFNIFCLYYEWNIFIFLNVLTGYCWYIRRWEVKHCKPVTCKCGNQHRTGQQLFCVERDTAQLLCCSSDFSEYGCCTSITLSVYL